MDLDTDATLSMLTQPWIFALTVAASVIAALASFIFLRHNDDKRIAPATWIILAVASLIAAISFVPALEAAKKDVLSTTAEDAAVDTPPEAPVTVARSSKKKPPKQLAGVTKPSTPATVATSTEVVQSPDFPTPPKCDGVPDPDEWRSLSCFNEPLSSITPEQQMLGAQCQSETGLSTVGFKSREEAMAAAKELNACLIAKGTTYRCAFCL